MDVPEGECTLRYEFEPTGAPDIRNWRGAPGRGQLYSDGDLVGNAEFPTSTPILFGIRGLSCRYGFGEAVTHEYDTPSAPPGRSSRKRLTYQAASLRTMKAKYVC